MREVARGSLLMAASGLSFGALTVLAKLALAEGSATGALLVLRFGLAALLLVPLAVAIRGGLAGFGRAWLLGIAGYFGTTLLYFRALPTIPAGIATFLLYLAPVFVAVLARFVLGERLTRAGLAGLAVGLVGLAALTLAPGVRLDPAGVALALGSSLVYAGTIVAGRRVVAEVDGFVVAAGACVGAATGWLLYALALGELVPLPTAAAWGYGVVIAVLCTAVAVALFYAGLPLVGAPRAAIVSMIEPASAVVIAYLVLGETLAPAQAAGCGLILVGVLLASR